MQILHGTDTIVTDLADVPAALSDLGLSMSSPTFRTLVVDRRATLTALRAAAHTAYTAPATRLIDWWSQRADHPTTAATLVVTERPGQRWAPPVPTSAKPSIEDWATWLHLPAAPTSAAHTLALARLVTGTPLLPDLTHDLTGDETDYGYRSKDRPDQWRHADSRRDAAMGLTLRSQSVELYESLRLVDPLVATRETRTGTVAVGVISDVQTVTVRNKSNVTGVRITTSQPVFRHRTDARLSVWIGDSLAPAPIALNGTLTDMAMAPDGRLSLTLTDVVNTGGRPALGATVTIRPCPTSTRQQSSKRGAVGRMYRSTGNWLARRDVPPMARRDVPLDVVIAAATD